MENIASTPYSILCPQNQGSFLFTAEHASNNIPTTTQASETFLLNTHWAYDIGIFELIQLLCTQLSCQGAHTNYSRLWIDCNRAPNQNGLIKNSIDGIPLSFNQNLTQKQCLSRLSDVHEAYHCAISSAIKKHSTPPILVSLHSFTPIWNDHIRTMDIGVLFDRDTALAHSCASLLREEGFFVEMNQPYSGKNGLIYAADRHGTEQNIPYIELEFNQSILCTPERISFVAQKTSNMLKKLTKTL
jgi:predicted N-formylglutamate amidohydrolase